MSDGDAIRVVHEVSGMTHNHKRAKIACVLYYFCVKEILNVEGDLACRMQNGLDKGFVFYEQDIMNLTELAFYGRPRDQHEFKDTHVDQIKSSGYVVDSLEAAIWALICMKDFRECLLTAVNLGKDTDTIVAIAGGLASLYYGYEKIPDEWLDVMQKRDWIEEMCKGIKVQ